MLVILPSCDTKPTTSKKLDDDLATTTPCRCTSSGNNGVAVASLFCTCTCAISGLVSASKVRVNVAEPLDSEVDDIYNKPSKPFIFCSITWVTESSKVRAEAPG